MTLIQRMYLSKNQKVLFFLCISLMMTYYVITQFESSERFPIINYRRMEEVAFLISSKYAAQTRDSSPPFSYDESDVTNDYTFTKYDPSTTDYLMSTVNINVQDFKNQIRNYSSPKTVNIRNILRITLREALKGDKGAGCELPTLNPFATEVTQFDKEMFTINCKIQDWFKCNFTKCSFAPSSVKTLGDGELSCILRDILYITDNKYELGAPAVLKYDDVYTLNKSDQITIECVWKSKENLNVSWKGIGIGHRQVTPVKPPLGRENTANVLIFAFDSVSRNTFIRKLPKSYKFITEELGAVVLNKYNIVGDGTPAALFPLLAGISEVDHPECRRNFEDNGYIHHERFIFYKLKKDGYRTAYYEDMPWIGTFQYRLTGFQHQPADHYVRHAFTEEMKIRNRTDHCFGSNPRFKFMMDLTDQFFKLGGKRFALTFIGDLTHEDFNDLPNADAPLVNFLKGLKQDGKLNNTLLVVMGDHGSRFSDVRSTYQGKLEERLPFMAVRLPDNLITHRPEAAINLKHNKDTLTNPFDIYTTVLDVIDLREHWNGYVIEGSDWPRGMTLLEKIPKNRSCSEAGILPHWCSCLKWEAVEPNNPICGRLAQTLVDYINNMTQFQRNKCAIRTLTSIDTVMKKIPYHQMLQAQIAKLDIEIYLGKFGKATPIDKQLYQIRITVGPASGTFEATFTHHLKQDKFYINSKEISRINAYKQESACVSATYPHLNKYCYCVNNDNVREPYDMKPQSI